MIKITIDRDEFIFELKEHDESVHNAFMQLSENEQNARLNDIIEHVWSQKDGDFYTYVELIEAGLTK